MKKRILIICTIILCIALAVFSYIILSKNSNTGSKTNVVNIKMHKDFKQVMDSDQRIVVSNNIITSYYEYKNLFDSDELKKEDFDNKNYLIVELTSNCDIVTMAPTKYKIKNNKIDITVEYEASCGLCAPVYSYYLLNIDKNITSLETNIKYEAINEVKCPNDVAWKPMIYLYPKEKTDVTVKLVNSDKLISTYPKYKDSWQVEAYPDGTLVDKDTNREYYGLYWEGKDYLSNLEKDGFIVAGKDTIKFLEEKLNILGLTDREANEFIVYWLPKLENNKYNYIRFADLDKLNNYMPLEVNPIPDTIIRILMEYKPLNKPIKIEEQKLMTPERTGFTLVEWGGSLIK